MNRYSCNALVRVPPRSTPSQSRWSLIVALLTDPVRESRRLIAELSRWPATAMRHSILDAGGRPPADAARVESNESTQAPDQASGEPQPKKKRKPLPRGEARFSAKRWAAEREARLARERDGVGPCSQDDLRVMRGPNSR